MHLSEMKKFPGTFLGAALGALIGVYLILTAPPKEPQPTPTPIPRRAMFPIAEIVNPECVQNDQELFIIEPKLFQTIPGDTLLVQGQATGAQKPVVVVLEDANDHVLQKAEALVDTKYPCSFSSAFSVGDLPSGRYTVRASYAGAKEGKSTSPVSVTVTIEK